LSEEVITHPTSEHRARALKLFLISCASLYFELLFLRWIPDSVHVLSFFGNFTLLAIFLGLGIGLSQSQETTEDSIFRKIVRNLSLLSAAVLLFDVLRFSVRYSGDYAFNVGPVNVEHRFNVYVVIFLFLSLAIYCFIPIGSLIRRYFATQAPLAAYTLNIAGSLAGILLFTTLSYFGTPLWFWMLIGLLMLLPFTPEKGKYALIFLIMCGVIVAENRYTEKVFNFQKFWSPYYGLQLRQVSKDHSYLTISNSFILSALNLSLPQETTREYYEVPYRVKKEPENVLVLGAGMGNDVAVGLMNGAKHIDAVEIDPMIIELGKQYHPLKPFIDPRVTIINDDARAFMRNSKQKYDLIVFGTLDSHGLFSLFSSIKMENYVYTVESFREAKNLLKDGGLLYVNTGFMGVEFVNCRLYNCLKEVFGKDPLFFVYENAILMYLTGNIEQIDFSIFSSKSFKRLTVNAEREKVESPENLILPTDDWPHLYLRDMMIPREYFFALLILFTVSAVFLFTGLKRTTEFHGFYFLLGAGFMLLETKCITEMGLIFGSTWIINAVVISSILLVILVANLFLLKAAPADTTTYFYLALGGALIFGYFVPLDLLNQENFAFKLLLSALYIAIPVFFSSLIFGINFRRESADASLCLAWNMLGSIFGGIIEYGSMIYGLKSLALFALCIYLLSYLLQFKTLIQKSDTIPQTQNGDTR